MFSVISAIALTLLIFNVIFRYLIGVISNLAESHSINNFFDCFNRDKTSGCINEKSSVSKHGKVNNFSRQKDEVLVCHVVKRHHLSMKNNSNNIYNILSDLYFGVSTYIYVVEIGVFSNFISAIITLIVIKVCFDDNIEVIFQINAT